VVSLFGTPCSRALMYYVICIMALRAHFSDCQFKGVLFMCCLQPLSWVQMKEFWRHDLDVTYCWQFGRRDAYHISGRSPTCRTHLAAVWAVPVCTLNQSLNEMKSYIENVCQVSRHALHQQIC